MAFNIFNIMLFLFSLYGSFFISLFFEFVIQNVKEMTINFCFGIIDNKGKMAALPEACPLVLPLVLPANRFYVHLYPVGLGGRSLISGDLQLMATGTICNEIYHGINTLIMRNLNWIIIKRAQRLSNDSWSSVFDVIFHKFLLQICFA